MGLLALKDGKMGVITKRGVIVVDTYNNHAENILIDKSSSIYHHPDSFSRQIINYGCLMESPMSFVVT